MQAEDVPARAEEAGGRLRAGLAGLPGVQAVRGLGLLLAAELEPATVAAFEGAKGVQAALLDAGLVTNAVTATALRFTPPLLVTSAEIDEALAISAEVLAGGPGSGRT